MDGDWIGYIRGALGERVLPITDSYDGLQQLHGTDHFQAQKPVSQSPMSERVHSLWDVSCTAFF